MIKKRSWTFNVAASTENGEVVCVIGSCAELGSWDPCSIIPLTHQEESSSNTKDADGKIEPSLWSVSLELPMNEVSYRYCVAVPVVSQGAPNITTHIIKRWETHFKPRSIPADVSQDADNSPSTFGEAWGQKKVEAGWLVRDTAVHFKLSATKNHADSILLWKKKHKQKQIRVKVTPMQLGVNSSNTDDTTEHCDTRLNQSTSSPLMEVAVLKEDDCGFKPQEQFGILFNEKEFTVFQYRTLSLETTAFMFDFYVEDQPGEIPRFIGSSYVLPSNLQDNHGNVTLPITSPKHLPIGQLKVHYLVVKPMALGRSDMSVSYTRYWKESWKGLQIGHRGAGNSFHPEPKSCSNIRENTIASMKFAAESGADMVEFDVQFTREHIPVIYHDFHAGISLKQKKEQDQSEVFEVPIKDLTLKQLQALKVYNKREKGLSKFSDEDFEDHQPFPTLERAFEAVPLTCGFNIEVKWTQLLTDGSHELLHPFELNNSVDLILETVFKHAGRRKIVFSSFHPDICSMLRLKQNRYPVLFLTQGRTRIWMEYDDLRTHSTRIAVMYAKTVDILGVNLHTEELLKDPGLVKEALDNDLVTWCWGDDNNDPSTISYLRELGMHAIVHDKIDEYNCKNVKESIFLCEERQGLSLTSENMLSTGSSPASSTTSSSSGSSTDTNCSPELPTPCSGDTSSSVTSTVSVHPIISSMN